MNRSFSVLWIPGPASLHAPTSEQTPPVKHEQTPHFSHLTTCMKFLEIKETNKKKKDITVKLSLSFLLVRNSWFWFRKSCRTGRVKRDLSCREKETELGDRRAALVQNQFRWHSEPTDVMWTSGQRVPVLMIK